MITVAGVLVAHGLVIFGLANIKSQPLTKVVPPKPVQVKFVHLQAPKPTEQTKPIPKPLPKPKDVPVVKEQPKPLPQPKLKRQPVVASKVASEHHQAVVPQQPDASPAPKVDIPTPAPAKADPAPATPKQVEGVAYKNPPQIDQPSDDELGGQARKVVVKVLINEFGRVDSIEIIRSSGIASLDSSVKRAVKRATFNPYRENGVAMPVYTLIPIEFQTSSN